MTATFTTRSDASAPPPELVELMAKAGYEATRTPSFPRWADTTNEYRTLARRAVVAEIGAARAAGYGIGRS